MPIHRKKRQIRKPNGAEIFGFIAVVVLITLVLTGTIHPSS